MKKTLLKVIFGAIFITMVVMTVHTQSRKSIMLSPNEFSWQTSPWACATLLDAYFGFITFYAWVWFKERTVVSRIVWFVLVMSLGNIAMSGYVLIELFRLGDNEPASAILTNRRALTNG